jgi:hypothetical protein
MPDKSTRARTQQDRREGKAPSTQAGEFVREEIHHIREGKHGARSAKQAIAIGLSKARRAGVRLPAPKASATKTTRAAAERDRKLGQHPRGRAPSKTRARATLTALRHEGHRAASHTALSRQAKAQASKRARARSA